MKRLFLLLAALPLVFCQGCGPGRALPKAGTQQNVTSQTTAPDSTRREPDDIVPKVTQDGYTKIVRNVTYVLESCDIVNPGARLYLEQVDYSDDPQYTRTDVNNPAYAEATDRPLPVKIQWEGGRATDVILSEDPFFTNPKTIATDADSPIEVYNLVPGVDYYYKVLAGGKPLKEGGVSPKGPLRMISTYEGTERPRRAVYNMRDLGGWKTPGGHIAYGKVYRGSNIDNLNDDPYAKNLLINELGISIDFDLRGYKGDEHNPEVPGLTYYQLPLRKNFEGGTGQTERLYKKAIRHIISWLDEGRVVYFHCAAGADRTGTLAFLIEALLGVSESDLSKDFEITTFDKRDKRWRIPRESDPTHTIGLLIPYFKSGQFGDPATKTINELVYNWATSETQDDLQTEYVAPLMADEIARLREHLIVND